MFGSLQIKYLSKSIFFFFFIFAVFSAYSQIRNAPLTKANIETAEQHYQKYCALCHGDNREGGAADYAPSLKSKSLMSSIPLNFLASSIGFGRPNTAMAAYLSDMGGPLNMKEIYNLAIWLQYKAGHKTLELSQEAISGDLKNGSLLFEKKCAECHGAKAEGITGPALGNPAFLAFATDAYIKYAIDNGREYTEMKAYKSQLTDEQRNDLTAYIRSLTSGWSPEPKELAPYPEPKNYILNPKGKSPDFKLIGNRYVPMAQVAEAIKNKNKMVILDTRTSSEWHNAHIPGAIPIPYYISENKVAKHLPKDDTWIIAYCACPHAASDKIIDMLRKKGFNNTAVIDEGFFGWINASHPVTAGKSR